MAEAGGILGAGQVECLAKRINHAQGPAASARLLGDRGGSTYPEIVTIRAIEAGEEILMNCGDQYWTTATRRRLRRASPAAGQAQEIRAGRDQPEADPGAAASPASEDRQMTAATAVTQVTALRRRHRDDGKDTYVDGGAGAGGQRSRGTRRRRRRVRADPGSGGKNGGGSTDGSRR